MSIIKKVFLHLKQHDLIMIVRGKRLRKNIRLLKNNPEKYLIKLCKINLKYNINLNNPQTFNEKINWYKLHYRNPLMKTCVDKIEVKKYIRKKGLDDILVKTYATYDSIDKIVLDKLPNSFVIKNTIDSGGVYVCKNKEYYNYNAMHEKLSMVDKTIINGKHVFCEWAYEGLKNRIIVEEYLKTNDGHAPWDYKFFCFNGEPKFLFVGSNRDTSVCFDFFDIDFNHLDVVQGHPWSKENIVKPKNYERMLEICRLLSSDFPHVRVDLYNIDGKIYFSELTFYHCAGLVPFKPKEWDYKFGEYFNINSIKGKE